MLNNKLFWELYRPKSMDDMVLLPRIQSRFNDGIQVNYIFHGHNGMGKSTLVRILLKDRSVKIINASIDNGIDVLREELEDFCKSMSSPLVKSDDKMKYVYLEEFERATPAFQDGFKAFIEEYDERVRFIITMNHINRVIKPLLSRFTVINFNPINNDEKRFLKNGYYQYLDKVSKEVKLNLDKDVLINIINKNFPDLRAGVQTLQDIHITKDVQSSLLNDTNEEQKVFRFLLDGKNDFMKNYDFVFDYMSVPEDLLYMIGRPFFDYLMKNNTELVKKKGITMINISRDYNQTYDNTMVDPLLHLTSYVCDMKKVINS